MKLSISNIQNYLFPTEEGISQALKSAIDKHDYVDASYLIKSYPHMISSEVYDQAFRFFTSIIGIDKSIAKFLVKTHPERISVETATQELEKAVRRVAQDYDFEGEYLGYASLLAETFPEHISGDAFSAAAKYWNTTLVEQFISLSSKMSQNSYEEALGVAFNHLDMKLVKQLITTRGEHTNQESYNKIFENALVNNENFAIYLIANSMVDYEYAISAKHALNKKRAHENGDLKHDPIKSIMEKVEVQTKASDKNAKVIIESKLTKVHKDGGALSSILDAASFGKPKVVVEGSNDNSYNLLWSTIKLHSFSMPEFMHELSHWLMHKLFNHGALPYYPPHYFLDGSDSTAEEYETMESKVLDNIAKYYLPNSETSDESRSSFQKGQEIMKAVIGQNINNIDCATLLLLIIYLPGSNYQNKEQAHQEFIVRYPQMVASGCYASLDEKRKEIVEPLAKYWNEKITPAIDFYNNWHAVPNTECGELVSVDNAMISNY